MAYKEVSRVEIIEVIRQWQADRAIREIARSTGSSAERRRTSRGCLPETFGLISIHGGGGEQTMSDDTGAEAANAYPLEQGKADRLH